MMFLLALSPVIAVRTAGTVAEASSVSRLVGDSPYDIINQLDTKQLNINHATHLSNRLDVFEDVTHNRMIYSGFDEANRNIKGDGVRDPATGPTWDGYDSIDSDIDQFEANEMFILESYIDMDDFGIYSKKLSKSDKIFPKDVEDWRQKFSETNPLFLFNIEGTGLALPNQPNYMEELTRYSTIIAPKDVRSTEFSTSVLCNIHDNQRIGDIYRRSRTKYYAATDPSDQNMPGLVLKSYALYGNPLTRIDVPQGYEDYAENISWWDFTNPCKNYYVPPHEYLYEGYGILETEDKFENTLDISYNIIPIDNGSYSIINSSDLKYNYDNENLIGVYVIRTHRLPKGSFVDNIESAFLNPDNLKISDYPSMMDEEFIDRNCYDSYQDERVIREVHERNNYDEIVVYINPLRVDDCESGDFTLFTEVGYSIDYIPSAPFYFDELDYEETVYPGEQIDLDFKLKYVSSDPVNGTIKITKENETIYERSIEERMNNYSVSFISSDKEEINSYELQYIENGTVKTNAFFDVETKLIDGTVAVGEFDGGSVDVDLKLSNYLDADLPVLIKAELADSLTEVYNQNIDLSPGENIVSFSVNSLDKADVSYGLKIYVQYMDEQRVFSDIIITNHEPIIKAEDVYFRVGENIDLGIEVYDMDGDSVSLNIIPGGFPRTALESDIGEQNITVEASDGLLTSEKVITLTVLPANFEPDLFDHDNPTIQEKDVASVIFYAEDIDGYNLTYSINDPRFKQVDYNWFEWQTELGDKGNYTIGYSVTDGTDVVSKTFNLTVDEYNCTPSWNCTAWDACVDNVSTRTCFDVNSCGISDGRPDEQQTCNITEENPITKFADGMSTKDIVYPSGGSSQTVYIRVPKDAEIIEARVDVTGVEG
ncbi:hypothetical protein GF361_03735 [Candidatus Woesearchaeota archaeon]|nr:hypothetical protein [Candidatus Woesearchaeota archaeon]